MRPTHARADVTLVAALALAACRDAPTAPIAPAEPPAPTAAQAPALPDEGRLAMVAALGDARARLVDVLDVPLRAPMRAALARLAAALERDDPAAVRRAADAVRALVATHHAEDAAADHAAPRSADADAADLGAIALLVDAAAGGAPAQGER